ncbi:hypothetical protein BD626DRAFT_2902 [Schizophyllum amplum]|uniref:Uncharacterized protein n=1 Tax=Schizophyllum amplum TaxID=97359 RepID=A0A550CVV9_9AGAR|nr:hypothetical protein BD626DRAFT_2902 [Auriculariopsis ampla]
MQASCSTSSAARALKKPSLSIKVQPTKACAYIEEAPDAQYVVIPADSEFNALPDEARHFDTPFAIAHRPMCVACDDAGCNVEDGFPRCAADERLRAAPPHSAPPQRDSRIASCHPLVDVEACEYAEGCELRSSASPALLGHLRVLTSFY